MINIKDFMELVEFKITEGSKYCWDCFGPNAYSLDSWNGSQEGYSASIVFDTEDQTVYQVSVYDYRNNRAYRMINPTHAPQHMMEATDRNVDADQAWDDVKYIELDVDEDFLDKARAIIAGEVDYDTRIQVPLDLSDEMLYNMMKLAHEQDVTLNQFVEQILQQAIKERL
jgi:hypothetical protein